MLCQRWYLKTLALHLSQDQVFQPVDSTWQQVRQKGAEDLEPLGYMVDRGLLYTYGAWKPKKATMRYITGVQREAPEVQAATEVTRTQRAKKWSGS